MAVQEVMLRAIDGRLKWYESAQILGISDRQMRRWKLRNTDGLAKTPLRPKILPTRETLSSTLDSFHP